MNLAETSNLLAFIAVYDNRRFDDATVLAWHPILADMTFTAGRDAVTRHFATSAEYLKPVHIRQLAEQIDRERRQAEREQREALHAERERLALDSRPLADRSAEVTRAVADLAGKLSAAETSDAARERALLRARKERGHPQPRSRKQRREPTSHRGEAYPPPHAGHVAALARQYLADGWNPDQLSGRLGISRKWLRRAATDRASLPAPHTATGGGI